jgi:hypothetical protein
MSDVQKIEIPQWSRALPFFSAAMHSSFFFKPFVTVIFGKPQPKVFPLKVFIHDNKYYCSWPTAGQFLSLLTRLGKTDASFPNLTHNYAVVGFAHPDHDRSSCGYPWESPAILIFGGDESHFGDIPPSAWLKCQQKPTYVHIVDESAESPVHPHDQVVMAARLASYQAHLPDLGSILPYPSEAVIREVFKLDDDIVIPANLLPPSV